MRTEISTQLLEFLCSGLLGAALGLLYDVFRAVRRRGIGPLWQSVLDGTYALAALWSVMAFVLAGQGELRLFMLLGAAGGAVLHFCLLSQLFAPILDFWLGIFLIPGRFLCGFVRKIQYISKKYFSFWKKGSIIQYVKVDGFAHRSRKGEVPMTPSTKPPKQQAAQRPKRGTKLTFVVLALLALGFGLQLTHMRGQLEEARAEEAVYAARMEALQETNDRLASEIEHSGDQELMEDIARDELGMAAPGEKIFRFH